MAKAGEAGIGRRERNKLEKRARIVQAARRLFGEKGFSETTTLEIAEAADIGAGTLFLYARSKEDLLVMVFRDEMIETASAVYAEVDPAAPLVDQLLHIFSAMMRYHARDPDLARILLAQIMFTTDRDRVTDIAELMRVIFNGLAGVLRAAEAAGVVRKGLDRRIAAETLFAIYYLELISWLRRPEDEGRFRARLARRLEVALGALL